MRIHLTASVLCVAFVSLAGAATIEKRGEAVARADDAQFHGAFHNLTTFANEAREDVIESTPEPDTVPRVRRRGCKGRSSTASVSTTSTVSSIIVTYPASVSVDPSVTVSSMASSSSVISTVSISSSSSASATPSSTVTSSEASSMTSSVESATLTSSTLSLVTSSAESSTSSSIETSSTVSSFVPTCTAPLSTDYLGNAGFERGELSPWTFNAGAGTLTADIIGGRTIEGCKVLKITPVSDSATGTRSATLMQQFSFPEGGLYTLEYYQGRLSSTPVTENLQIVVIYNGNVRSAAYACGTESDPCDLTGTDGTVWQKVTVPLSASTASTLQIVFSWISNTLDGSNSPVLVDGFTIQ